MSKVESKWSGGWRERVVIALDSPERRRSEMGRFLELVRRGAELYAAPETAQKIMDLAAAKGYSVTVHVFDLIQEGDVLAVDKKGFFK